MSNVNDTYFDGVYKDIWKSIIPPELTARETDFLIRHYGLGSQSRVMDLMCGYGRHALALARQGIEVTAVDNLADYTGEMASIQKAEDLPLKVIQSGILDFKPQGQFDLALCMGNSLNFFAEEALRQILGEVSLGLVKAGGFVIHTWSLAEIAIRQFNASATTSFGDVQVQYESQYLFNPARIETRSLSTWPEGGQEEKMAIDYIFSVGEMTRFLLEAGLEVEGIYSVPGKRPFQVGDPRAYILARKA